MKNPGAFWHRAIGFEAVLSDLLPVDINGLPPFNGVYYEVTSRKALRLDSCVE